MSWTIDPGSFTAAALNAGRHVGLQCLILGGFGIALFLSAALNQNRILCHSALRSVIYLLGRQRARYMLAILGLAMAVIAARVWLANMA